MENGTITKTVWQYSEKLPEETMDFLRGVAKDYGKVKNNVYQKYSGISWLNRLTPVYTILNEMRSCGLREQLGLPVVYYELAVADAVRDIKTNWENLKNRLRTLVSQNANLTDNERQYIRTVLRMNNIYAAILNCEAYEMPQNASGLEADTRRLNNLIRRLTRKHLKRPTSIANNYFRISPAGYSYKNDMFCIVCRTPRKRIGIELKDDRQFDRQLVIYVREDSIAIAVPLDKKVIHHPDYKNTLYAHVGNMTMMTLSTGREYGKELDRLVKPETARLSNKNAQRIRSYRCYRKSIDEGRYREAEKIKENNLGKIKYNAQKQKARSQANDYINRELNRLIREEKPGLIVITRPVTINRTSFYNSESNRTNSRSFQGYIRERLKFKAKLNGITIEEINSKGTGSICSGCGAKGVRSGNDFICGECGLNISIALNGARNIENKYKANNKDKSNNKKTVKQSD